MNKYHIIRIIKMPHVRLLQQQDRYWNDHYYLTREVIRDAVNNSKCLSTDVNVLFTNQKNLGKNFGRLTRNRDAEEQLTKELTIHIEIALEIVKLAIQGKNIDEAYKRWMKNGKRIAYVYSKYHPRIKFDIMNQMMQEHLKTTLAEAVAIISKNCRESQEKGQAALHHIRMMSDYIISTF